MYYIEVNYIDGQCSVKNITGKDVARVSGKAATDLLRGHTDTIVLSILLQGDNYGYEIRKTIIEKTHAQFELKEATLYSSYKRLEQDGAIISYWGDETKGSRRKYYQITDHGRAVYEQNTRDWALTQQILNTLLEVQ